ASSWAPVRIASRRPRNPSHDPVRSSGLMLRHICTPAAAVVLANAARCCWCCSATSLLVGISRANVRQAACYLRGRVQLRLPLTHSENARDVPRGNLVKLEDVLQRIAHVLLLLQGIRSL